MRTPKTTSQPDILGAIERLGERVGESLTALRADVGKVQADLSSIREKVTTHDAQLQERALDRERLDRYEERLRKVEEAKAAIWGVAAVLGAGAGLLAHWLGH